MNKEKKDFLIFISLIIIITTISSNILLYFNLHIDLTDISLSSSQTWIFISFLSINLLIAEFITKKISKEYFIIKKIDKK